MFDTRKQFEEWAKQNGYDVDMKGNQKSYPFAKTQCAWEIWQAAINYKNGEANE